MFQGLPRDVFAINDREPGLIPLHGDNITALRILLNIVHGRNGRVIRRVGLNTFLQIVVLIDKYEFHEAALVYMNMWFDALRHAIPQVLDHHLASWVYICWQLEKSEEFNTLTKIAIWETSCDLEDPNGVVPFWVIGKRLSVRDDVSMLLRYAGEVQSRRQGLLTEFVGLLAELLETYQGSRPICPQDTNCDALLFGKLARGLKSAELYPVPEVSSLHRSIKDLFSTVQEIDLGPLCENYKKNNYKSRFSSSNEFTGSCETCHLSEKLQSSLSSIENRVVGLDINERSKKSDVGK